MRLRLDAKKEEFLLSLDTVAIYCGVKYFCATTKETKTIFTMGKLFLRCTVLKMNTDFPADPLNSICTAEEKNR
jgi:hypothetical protein